ncbi:MAG: ATP-dependent Clp protease proteolytic subunit [Tabrizicola sp.]|nr:ATP-dependent Clp protease proteolytic subunit [Tabrizicola sp.]
MASEIFLYGSVGESFWGEASFTPKDVRDQLAAISGPVEVFLNSGGGSATDGQAIYSILKAHPYKVTVVIEGCAASAASLIAMAGAEIVLTDGAWLLLHDPATPFTDGRGTPDDHAKTAQLLEQLAGAYAEIYARRSGNSVEDVRALMRAETLLIGDAAVQMGFADRIDREAETKAVAAFDYRVYATAPKAVRRESERLGAFQGKEAVLAMIAGVAGAAMETKMNVRVPPPQGGTGGDEPQTKIKMTALQVTDLHARAARMQVDSAKVNAIIEAGHSFETALVQITDLWAERGDNSPPYHRPMASLGADFSSPRALANRQADALAAKLAARMGLTHEPTIGREFMDLSLQDMAAAQLRAAGVSLRHPSEAIYMTAGHTGSDFPLLIAGGMTAVARRMAEQQDPAISRCARVIEAQDYRPGNAVSLTGSGQPRVVLEGAEIEATTILDEGEVKAVPQDNAVIFRISRQALVNDMAALDQFSDILRAMMKGAMERKRQILLAPLLANSGAGQTMRDTQPLFHSTHGNLAGTGTAISVGSIGTARTAMRRQRDSNGILLNVEPRFLLVPPELETLAQQTVTAIMAARPADVNPFGGVLDVVAEPGLTNTTAWYLVADPSQIDGLVLAYLTGNETPQIDTQDGWNTLGLEARLVWSLGSAAHSWQALYRNPGA